jgi:hypothetical protein
MAINAYRLTCKGIKLDNKDGLLGKSGMLMTLAATPLRT